MNRSPTRRLKGITPKEAWPGNRPGVSHFRIFGSLSFRHVLEPTRRKLDDCAEQMVLLGYHPTGAYKLYDPRIRKVVINKDVMDETRCWNWETNTARSIEKTVVVNLKDDQHKESDVKVGNQPRRSLRERPTP